MESSHYRVRWTRPTSFCSTILCNRRDSARQERVVSGHVRVPAYIRGKTGTIVHVSTPAPFPDAAGHNMPAEIEPTYDVRFCARDLWPDTSDEALNHVAVFQSYLEKVESA